MTKSRGLGKGGWGRTKGSKKISDEVLETIYCWKDIKSRHKRIHISLIGESEALCGNIDIQDTIARENVDYDPKAKTFCQNCLRVALGLDPESVNNQTVKQALKTVSKKKSKSTKRLNNYRKVLSKSKSEMQADMEKAFNESSVKLPTEITSDKESLLEAINASLPVLSMVRKTAMLNLDRTVSEFKKADPDSNDYEIIQETHNIKSLVKAIDKIKQFAKQL